MAIDKEDLAQLEKLFDDKLTSARDEWAKTRSWRHARFASIKADWQASACCAVAGALLVKAYPYAAKFLAWVV